MQKAGIHFSGVGSVWGYGGDLGLRSARRGAEKENYGCVVAVFCRGAGRYVRGGCGDFNESANLGGFGTYGDFRGSVGGVQRM